MYTPEDRINRLIRVNRIRRELKKQWPEICGLTKEKNNGTPTFNGNQSASESSRKAKHQREVFRTYPRPNIKLTRQDGKEALWNVCVFLSAIVVVTGFLLGMSAFMMVLGNLLKNF